MIELFIMHLPTLGIIAMLLGAGVTLGLACVLVDRAFRG